MIQKHNTEVRLQRMTKGITQGMTFLLILSLIVLLSVACTKKSDDSAGTEHDQTQTSGDDKEESQVDDGEEVSEDEEQELKELVVWTYSDEFLTEIDEFEEAFDCKVNVEIKDIDGYVPMTVGVLKGGLEGGPDVLLLSNEDIKNPMIQEHILDLSTVYGEEVQSFSDKFYPYVYQDGFIQDETSGDSQLKGLPYQITPVGLYYRRSFAMDALGVSEPEEVQPYFENYTKLLELAKALEASDVKLVNDIYGLEAFTNIDGQSFIDENGYFFVADSKIELLELIKEAKLEGYMSNLTKWSDEWLQSMYSWKDNDVQPVFTYVLPSWSLANVVMLVGEDDSPVASSEDEFIKIYNETMGDWGVIQLNPASYFGGAYFSLTTSGVQNDLAVEFLRFMTLDEGHLATWFEDSYMISANIDVQEGQTFDLGDEFLGGQSYQGIFGDIGTRIQPTNNELSIHERVNDEIQVLYNEMVHDFIKGEFHTVAEAIKTFKTTVSETFPEYIWNEAMETTDSEENEENSEGE